MTLVTMTTFFGWMIILNFGLLLFSTIALLAGRDKFTALHAGLFQMEQADVKNAYFSYLANYKILIIVFCLMPYIALKLM